MNDRSNNFTIIHIIAAILVVFGHQFNLLGIAAPTILGIDAHGLGVKILFLVSGYLVSASYLRSNNPLIYLWKRLVRLYPPLLVCLLVTVISLRIVTQAPEYYWQSAVRYILNNLEMRPKFDLAGVFANNPLPGSINGSLWTIPIEVACYLGLIPLLSLCKLLLGKRKAAGGYIVLVCLLFAVTDNLRVHLTMEQRWVLWDTDWSQALLLCEYFCIGVVFQLLNLKKYCNLQIAALTTLICLCLPSGIRYAAAPFAVSYLVLSLALVEKPLFARFIKRDICYGLYLYAFPVQQLLIDCLIVKRGYNISVYVMFILSVGVTWLLAELNYCLLERRITLRKHN